MPTGSDAPRDPEIVSAVVRSDSSRPEVVIGIVAERAAEVGFMASPEVIL